MAWSRIKNIAILILALANLFLLVLVVGREGEDARQQAEALRSAVQILEKNGISVREEALPASAQLSSSRVEPARGGEADLAEALLGRVTEEERGGGVFRYVAENGSSIQFHSTGEFYAAFSDGTFPLQGKQVEEHAVSILKKLDISCQVLSVQAEKDGSVWVTVRQTWEGHPIYTCTALLQYEGGELRGISDARRLNGIPLAVEGEEPLTIPTVLMRFYTESHEQGYVFSEIISVQEGYVFTSSLSGPAGLTPVWRIETDAALYQMDPDTGDFNKVEQ